jgi:FtsH-binding integral membrane protein
MIEGEATMFIGHYGVGFGAKTAAPRTSLGTLFLAAQFVDLLWPTLLLLGLEHVAIVPGITRVTPLDFEDYPISHSLLAVVVWAALFAGVYFLVRRYRTGAVVCGLALVSHWILDLLVHRPDLPLAPGSSARLGLGLWNSLPATLALELTIFGLGLFFYLRTTRAADRTGSVALWALVGFLLLVYAGNILGPPPPSAIAIAWAGQSQWLLIAWAYWIDRHRVVVADTPAA